MAGGEVGEFEGPGDLDPLVGCDCVSMAPGTVQRPGQHVPVPVRVERVKSHRLAHARQCLIVPAQIRQDIRSESGRVRIVRVERGRALRVKVGVLELSRRERNLAQDALAVAVIAVEPYRFARELEGSSKSLFHDSSRQDFLDIDRQRQICAGTRVIRVELDGPLEHRARFDIRALVVLSEVFHTTQHAVIGCQIGRRLALGPLGASCLDAHGEACGNRRCDLILHREQVFEWLVVTIRPEVGTGCHVNELRGYPDPTAGLAHAAFDDILSPERAPNLLQAGLAIEGERGIPSENEQLSEAGKLGDHVLGDTFAEIRPLGISAQVGEGQHRDSRLCG
jgi:hypothetical protein